MKAMGGGLFGAIALVIMLPVGVTVLLYGAPILLALVILGLRSRWFRAEVTHFVLAFPEEYAQARHEMRAAKH